MTLKRNAVLTLSLALSFGLAEGAWALRANTGMISTSDAVSDLTRAQNQAKIDAFVSRKDVQTQLEKYGVAPAEASQRLASLSDSELQAMAGQIDQAPAGGEVVIISLTTILLIILILILLGKL
ncbi:MAG: PA2779 family protein [Bdellovibrionota bacterium]